MTKPKLIHYTPRAEGDLSADCSDFARLSRDSIHTARHDTVVELLQRRVVVGRCETDGVSLVSI